MNPLMHAHVARWFKTRHSALTPQRPGQGSMHFLFWQALSDGHSGFVVHSGLQATYGSPKYSGIHWQAAARFLSEHRALDPQGEGLQGWITSIGVGCVVIRWQAVKASPVYPTSHLQRGRWLLTVQDACAPHTPGQGSRQCWFMQALSLGHSGLVVHSGLHSM